MGVGLVIGFIEHLQIVTTGNCIIIIIIIIIIVIVSGAVLSP
jgi:hypothetical protein